MQPTDTATLLQVAPEEHQKRCTLARSAIEARRWPQAACGLRHAAAEARIWADQVAALADQCDAEAESGRVHSTVQPTLLDDISPSTLPATTSPQTLESQEAGLMALAHFVGRRCAVNVHRAMNGVLREQEAERAAPISPVLTLPLDAVLVGASLDAESIEQAEPA